LLKSAWGNVGTSVSFELVYPELIASEVNNGASLLVNVSDLSWFHNNVLSKQLLAAAVSRAVENGRYLVLASNTGISAVVNPLGVVTSNSLMGQSGNLIDRVQFLSNRTHYNRMWWLWRPSYRLWWH
jgi:apolipoprotein N-acyltransferase